MSVVLDYTGGVFAAKPKGGKLGTDPASIGDGSTLDLLSGNKFVHVPSANVAYVFSNPPASGTAIDFTLKVTPSATVTITWPSSVKWAGGTAPTAPANGETDAFTFFTTDGGTTYYGFHAGDAYS